MNNRRLFAICNDGIYTNIREWVDLIVYVCGEKLGIKLSDG